MTTIAVKEGVMAADSKSTITTEEGGSSKHLCEKMYRKIVTQGIDMGEYLIGVSGESAPGLVFLDWYGTHTEEPKQRLIDGEADFTAIVLHRDGSLWEYDKWCRGERVTDYDKFGCYAIGSGRKAAMGAMLAGKSSYHAVMIACTVDACSGEPVLRMAFKK